jgi:urea transport system ATP-binding protein|tara:strand:+ start:2617 stop:3417 length:801 start_codon:yes stop_codon:yes gene_type:complete
VSEISHKLLAPEEVAASAPEPGDALLYVEGVSVSFDGFKALNDLNFYASARQMEAMIGPNGAGKTTMMDVISGKTKPDQGRLIFRGDVDLAKLDEAAIANLGIGRKFQKPTVFENHTVFDNLELALKGHRGVFHAVFKRLSADERVRIDEVLGIISLVAHTHRRAGDLSHGQKQWLEIGMLLMQDPELLMVDEPVAGMTDAETEDTAQLLRRIAETHSVMVVEHDMDFVRALDTRVSVLHEGSVIAQGSLDTVQNDERVIEIYLGR